MSTQSQKNNWMYLGGAIVVVVVIVAINLTPAPTTPAPTTPAPTTPAPTTPAPTTPAPTTPAPTPVPTTPSVPTPTTPAPTTPKPETVLSTNVSERTRVFTKNLRNINVGQVNLYISSLVLNGTGTDIIINTSSVGYTYFSMINMSTTPNLQISLGYKDRLLINNDNYKNIKNIIIDNVSFNCKIENIDTHWLYIYFTDTNFIPKISNSFYLASQISMLVNDTDFNINSNLLNITTRSNGRSNKVYTWYDEYIFFDKELNFPKNFTSVIIDNKIKILVKYNTTDFNLDEENDAWLVYDIVDVIVIPETFQYIGI